MFSSLNPLATSKVTDSTAVGNAARTTPAPPLNNSKLLEYATCMVNLCRTPDLLVAEDDFRLLPPLGNSCVCPVVVARAWGLLALMADGKTRRELTASLAKMIGCEKNAVHERLGTVDRRLLGAVNFFAEYPKHALIDEEILGIAKEHYSSLLDTPLQKMCFLSDHDSLRASYLINKANSEATAGRIKYVVREDNAPNRCAQTVLTSAVDCTFYWKHETGRLRLVDCLFGDAESKIKTVVRGWNTKGNFYTKKYPAGVVLRLDSYQNDLNLILYMPHGDPPPSAAEVLEMGKNISASKNLVKIFVPQMTVSVPLCLRDCSRDGPFNMKRVFDREKSDLSGYVKKFHEFSPTLEVLWDHYHKAVFTIVDGKKAIPVEDREPRLQIGFQERCKEKMSSWNYEELQAQYRRYHEDYLPPPSPLPDALQVAAAPKATGDVVFDRPFYFMVVQDIHSQPLIHCYGRFTNADAVMNTSRAVRPSCFL